MLLFSPMFSGNGARAYILYAVTIFLSAFLLFQIQPIAGKLLLPWFGGSSSVWATSMLFFTSMLFAGYLYVYVLCKRDVGQQVRIHLFVVCLGALAALVSLLVWGSIYPPLDWTIDSSLAPALKTLLVLVSGIGIPYFLLSTTGPLLQYWYGISAQREPYKLYAVSNAGSLLALACYPFLVVPCAFSPKLLSILYAALPAFLMLVTTTEITQDIAPLPLLWIVPLSLYLLSFIIAFAGFRAGSLVPLALGGSG